MEKKRLADILNIDDIQYQKYTRVNLGRAIVSYNPSSGLLTFNKKMTELLNIEKWNQVIVGYDKRNEILVLKCCDAEEYGSVAVRVPAASKRDKQYIEHTKCRRSISIKHLVHGFNIPSHKRYHAEREGELVLLHHIDEDKQEI